SRRAHRVTRRDVAASPEGEIPPPSPTDASAPAPFTNEPHAELRRPARRAWLAAAVADAPRAFAFAAPALIDGRPVPTAAPIASVDPGDVASVVCRAGRAGPAEAERAIAGAATARPPWRAASWGSPASGLF